VSQLNAVLKEISDDIFDNLNAEEKWSRIFKAPLANESLKNLYRLVSAIFSVLIFLNKFT
jgi:hypothetical protein